MKTKRLFSLILVLLFLFSNSIIAQNGIDSENQTEQATSIFSVVNVDDLTEGVDLYSLEDEIITIDYYETAQEPAEVVLFALTMIAMGAGIGFVDDDTLWCLHAAYYMRLALYTNTALYGALGIVYSGLSGNSFTQSFIDFQLKMLFFTAITKYKQVHLIYGLLLAYGLGNNKFDGFKSDITRLTIGAIVGFNIILAAQWSIMLQMNPFAYISQTTKPDGQSENEFKDNFTSFLFNKENIVALSLVYNFALRSRNR